jgi:Cof subfamily protein (haloacid dehalogenase superfamily)
MPIRLLALDLDGTLIDGTLRVSPRVQRALRRAMDAGVHVTLATGRSFGQTRHYAQMLGIATPLICYQGAVVQDPASEVILFRCGVPLPLAREFVELARAEQWSLGVITDDGLHAERVTEGVRFFAEYGPIAEPVIAVQNLDAVLTEEPIKLIVVTTDEEAAAVNDLLTAHFDGRLRIVRSFTCFVEGTNLAASKGQALAFLAQRLGVAQAETMAIGDHDNDADMVAWAGCGVAMGNASAAVKAGAAYIAPPLEEDGAAEAIERFVLEG